MPEIKHNFTGGKMNKDVDERLVPNGEYRDAMNIQVSTSKESEVGTVQNILGNIEGCTYTNPNLNPILPGSSTVGSISDEKNDALYWFVAGKKEKLNDLGDADLSIPYFEKDLIMRKTSAGCEPVFVDLHTIVLQNLATKIIGGEGPTGWSPMDIETTYKANTLYWVLNGGVWQSHVEPGMFVTGIGVNGQSNTVMINDVVDYNPYTNPGTLVSFSSDLILEPIKAALGPSPKYYGPFKYLYIHKDKVLKFDKDKQITGINIIDDMLLWTDNNTEPKKINISRSIEGTNSNGLFHTKLINNFVTPKINLVNNTVSIREEHITVIKKSPTTALNVDLQTARDASKNYTGVIEVTSSQSFYASSFVKQDQPWNIHSEHRDFSTLDIGDTFWVKFNRNINDAFNFTLDSLSPNGGVWQVGDKVVLKEFDGDTPPTIPIGTNYRIKGVVADWHFNKFDAGFDTGPAGAPFTPPGSSSLGVSYPTGDALVAVKITSIVGNPPTANADTGILKYAIDAFRESEKLFELKFPRFSYRYKYQDGEYSNFAPFTEAAFSPGSFDYHPKKGYNLGMTNRTTSAVLRDFITSDMPQDVIEIDLLYKEDASPNVYIVNTIKPQDTPIGDGNNAWYSVPSGTTTASGAYEITSDTIYASVASNQLLRPWDNVPRKALAQEITSNRVVYGNYVQNYNLTVASDPVKEFYPKFTHDIISSGTTLDKFGRDNIKSIKSLRDYQLGVVFADEYGRETPVLSNPSGTFKLDKTRADDENRLVVEMSGGFVPDHFKYYKFFIKETSGQYYNIAMDRFYDAEDGNYWLAFPSSDRNKIDIDTFLILKKSADSDNKTQEELLKVQARYKIIAIENEAPDFIKTSRYNIGEAFGVFGDSLSGNRPPVFGTTDFAIFTEEFDKGSAGMMHEIVDPLYVEFEDIQGGEVSNRYRITEINKSNLDSGDNKFFIKLDKPLAEDVDFLLDDINNPTRIKGTIKIRFFKYVVENKPQFDGRFFVKVYADEVFEQYIKAPQKLKADGEYRVVEEKAVYYMAEDHVDRHDGTKFGSKTAVYSGDDPSDAEQYGTIINQLMDPRNRSWIEEQHVESIADQVISSDYLEHGPTLYTIPGYWTDVTAGGVSEWVPASGGYQPWDTQGHPFDDFHMTSDSTNTYNPPYGYVNDHDNYSNLYSNTQYVSGSSFAENPYDSSFTGTWVDPHTHITFTTIPGVDLDIGYGMPSNQGFGGSSGGTFGANVTYPKPGNWDHGWGHGWAFWDGPGGASHGKKWSLRQGPTSLVHRFENGEIAPYNAYQTLYGEFDGKITDATFWYNIPSSFRDSGAERLGDFDINPTGSGNSYRIRNRAGFLPLAYGATNLSMYPESTTTHENNPDGHIKQDLYRFIPPTVDDWFYYTAYFATYEERHIRTKVFIRNPWIPGTSGMATPSGSNVGDPSDNEDMKFFDHDELGWVDHMYFDVLADRGSVENHNEYEDVWYIDDCAHVGTNSHNQDSWGENYKGAKWNFHNYPHLDRNPQTGKLTAKREETSGIIKFEQGSKISLSFGGIDPETREIQAYYKDSSASPTETFEQFSIEGVEGGTDNFWNLSHPTRTKYQNQAPFVNKLNSGRQFRWKEDPTNTIYTINAQVDETNRLRYDSNPLSWEGKSTGGSFGTHHNYDKRFEKANEPNINAQFPLNIGNRIENFFKNYKIQITPEISDWDPTQGGVLGPIPGGRRIDNFSPDGGVTLTTLKALTAAANGAVENRISIAKDAFQSTWDSTMGENSSIKVGMILTEVNGSVLANPFLVKEIRQEHDSAPYVIYFTGYDNNPENIGTISINHTLVFEQPIMNGLSVNSAKNITDGYSDSYLGMGAVGYTIQFIEPLEKDQILPEDPSIWETEPKESTDLDIYYEISGNNPIKIDSSTIKTAVPIGSTINGYEVTGYVGDEIELGPSALHPDGMDQGFIDAIITITDWVVSLNFIVVKPDGSSFNLKPDPIWFAPYMSGKQDLLVNKRIKLDENNYNISHTLNWYNCYAWGNGVESNRIRDSFNLPFISNGVKASTTLEEQYQEEHRKYGLIYSGIYNSNSGVNNLNQFIQAEPITKEINPIYGSIQKLHSQSTAEGDLITLCEDRVLKILANKDAIFNADGNINLTATNNVLGQTIPFSGEFGISKNPESFASEAYRVYFADKVRGAIIRLSKDGLTPISDNGMKGWFRDNLKLSNKIIGGHDDKKNEYNITLKDINKTITFREDVRGWVSFKSFFPDNTASMANDYYTFLDGNLYKHHINTVNRNTFYDNVSNIEGFTSSSVNVVLNDIPSLIKSFSSLNYEGSQAKVYAEHRDNQYFNLEDKNGWYIETFETNKEKGSLNQFIEKEGKWFGYLKGQSVITDINDFVVINEDTSSSFDQASFAIQGIGTSSSIEVLPCEGIAGCTDPSYENYNPDAVCDDGTCTNIIAYPAGCTNPLAENYDPLAVIDDGSCLLGLCGDQNATNFGDPLPCLYGIGDFTLGCTNPNASNYNANAQADDNTCCPSQSWLDANPTISTSPHSPTQISITVNWTTPVSPTTSGYAVWIKNVTANTSHTSTTFPVLNQYTWIGPSNAEYIVRLRALCEDGSYVSTEPHMLNRLPHGCIDVNAFNYDPSAIYDDGSCCYVAGCTDPKANNYDPAACFDDGSCVMGALGCTNIHAQNYDPDAEIDDGSCQFPCTTSVQFSSVTTNCSQPFDPTYSNIWEITWSLMMENITPNQWGLGDPTANATWWRIVRASNPTTPAFGLGILAGGTHTWQHHGVMPCASCVPSVPGFIPPPPHPQLNATALPNGDYIIEVYHCYDNSTTWVPTALVLAKYCKSFTVNCAVGTSPEDPIPDVIVEDNINLQDPIPIAPVGYHYMPDGTLMSDLDMETPMSSETEDEPSPTNQY